MDQQEKRLKKLSGSDFEIADGQPDIRGWDVRNGRSEKIGEVDELIFDTESRKVRYVVIDMNENDLDIDEKEILVPIGLVHLHEEEDDVIFPGVTEDQLRRLPDYDEDRFHPEMEQEVCSILAAPAEGGIPTMHAEAATDFYNQEHFNEDNLYQKRLPDAVNTEDSSEWSGRMVRERSEASGMEVQGYTGEPEGWASANNPYNEGKSELNRTEQEPDSIRINSEPDETSRQQTTNQDLMEGGFLTGDNIRNVQDDLNRDRGPEQDREGERNRGV